MLFLVILQEIFALTLGEAYLIIFGVLFILVVLYFPYGLVGIFDRLKRLTLPPLRAR
jgi:ABC-type branched-subunit amino acid transport system permease subunit